MVKSKLLRQRRQHEERCKRCAGCCYEKIIYRGRVYITDIPCQFLDLETRLCRVYSRRCHENPHCTVVDAAVIAAAVLPAQCAYVSGVRHYRPPRSWLELPARVRKKITGAITVPLEGSVRKK